MPSGWRLMTVTEAKVHIEELKPFLPGWTIALLADGGKIAG